MPATTEKVSLQLKWLHPAQFAGHYLAEDKGFFAEEGLEVDIKPGGPGFDPEKHRQASLRIARLTDFPGRTVSAPTRRYFLASMPARPV
jgi:hypothetical protein